MPKNFKSCDSNRDMYKYVIYIHLEVSLPSIIDQNLQLPESVLSVVTRGL